MAKQPKKQAAAAPSKKVCTRKFAKLQKHARNNPNDIQAATAAARGAQPGKNRKPTTPGSTRQYFVTDHMGVPQRFVMSIFQRELCAKVKKATLHEQRYLGRSEKEYTDLVKEGTLKSVFDIMAKR